jgi:hypothetical protein
LQKEQRPNKGRVARIIQRLTSSSVISSRSTRCGSIASPNPDATARAIPLVAAEFDGAFRRYAVFDGFRITFAQVAEVGWAGLATDVPLMLAGALFSFLTVGGYGVNRPVTFLLF